MTTAPAPVKPFHECSTIVEAEGFIRESLARLAGKTQQVHTVKPCFVVEVNTAQVLGQFEQAGGWGYKKVYLDPFEAVKHMREVTVAANATTTQIAGIIAAGGQILPAAKKSVTTGLSLKLQAMTLDRSGRPVGELIPLGTFSPELLRNTQTVIQADQPDFAIPPLLDLNTQIGILRSARQKEHHN